MASAHKTSPSTPSGSGSNRSKKATSKSLIVRLKLSSASLAKFLPAAAEPIKSESQATDDKPASSSTTSSLSDSKAPTASPLAEGEASNGNTPVPSGTDDSVAMPPPAEGVKGGKGKKRASLLVDGVVKPRGKPGPKKRKLDDGTADSPSSKPPHLSTAHKLGPKANQGAINAGLRALDRSGAPCRKWARGGFAIKSFTGTTWEIPRWRAPPKVSVTGVDGKGEGENGGEGSSGKENKDSSQVESEKSNAGRDVEMSSPGVQASSPAPAMVAAAS
ncbi:hypothetical protein VE01_02237 [Pseudogymnoascus verrucosus]|uniref:INO80 complex subunit n=1 Tax=Pseudogymnoascus verrucosus TaxID=342668 RepID=A0A1B8GVL2_9PEZI|nr:uncharacterized protein VE01_02237 [Pseudogymnoascus verrucosus]OBT99885.1 hypothetical protein VE01_02237 [Pseudogymnoascus verrucosus]